MLEQQGRGFYTISSATHEANALVAMALRPTDPALLHERSGAFSIARAGQVPLLLVCEDGGWASRCPPRRAQ